METGMKITKLTAEYKQLTRSMQPAGKRGNDELIVFLMSKDLKIENQHEFTKKIIVFEIY
jgi:hypothetical protein